MRARHYAAAGYIHLGSNVFFFFNDIVFICGCIGLARKFDWVFPFDVTEKPE